MNSNEKSSLHDTDYFYRYQSHEPCKDKEGKFYCRALQIIWTCTDYCVYCPCLTKNKKNRMPVCSYYDIVREEDSKELSAEESYEKVEAMVTAGLLPYFPDFVSENCEDLLIEQALQYASVAHAGQVRKGSMIPYIVHPMEVAAIIREMTDNKEIIAAGILHDVLEDTPCSKKEIEKIFGKKVLIMVEEETENKRYYMPASDSWKIRKQEMIGQIQHDSMENKMIVLADKLSNMRATKRSYQSMGAKVWERFNMKDPKQHEWYYFTIADVISELSNTRAYQEYINLCREVFRKEG